MDDQHERLSNLLSRFDLRPTPLVYAPSSLDTIQSLIAETINDLLVSCARGKDQGARSEYNTRARRHHHIDFLDLAIYPIRLNPGDIIDFADLKMNRKPKFIHKPPAVETDFWDLVEN